MENVSVLIVSQSLDHKGIIANSAFVLGLTAGKLLPQETFGPDVVDGNGSTHMYLTKIGHTVRVAGQNKIRALREEFLKMLGVTVVDYTEDAAPADYDAYAKSLGVHKGEEIIYRALHVYGPAAEIIAKTKNLSALH